MNKKLKKIVIATGGTGGHIFPAYSLAKHFTNLKIDVELTTDKRGLKYLKNFNDISITKIATSTIYKKNIFKLTFSSFIIFYSIFHSLIFLLSKKPNFVFGMGGYSSFPLCVAAKMLGIPVIIYENNLHIGKANKYLLPFAKKILVSYGGLKGIKNKYIEKKSIVGNIIRKEFFNFQPSLSNYKNFEKIKILVLGGSQAAKVFAEKLPKIFKNCNDIGISLKIYQQCTPDQNDYLTSFYKKSNIDYEIFNFSNNILEYFSKVNLAITRSGSSMLAELLNARIPFISVPLPTSADNHQLENAIYYKKNQYSYLIEEKNLNEKLFNLIKLIHGDSSLLNQITINQKKYSDKFVYEKIEKEIDKIINEKY